MFNNKVFCSAEHLLCGWTNMTFNGSSSTLLLTAWVQESKGLYWIDEVLKCTADNAHVSSTTADKTILFQHQMPCTTDC